MEFKDHIKQLSERVEKLKDSTTTEEATKNAFIMPFIQALGYDVFNPNEVVPEYTCDIGTKKGEKIDYAIMKDGKPVILIECKHWGQDLTLHENQLLRYFHVSPAKFGLLTNGIVYRFYTDLDTTNKMDEKPFLDVHISEIKDNHIAELHKFHKSKFDVDNILNSASELKYTGELKQGIRNELENPSPEFVRLFTKQVYSGLITAKVLEQFTALTKKSFHQYINELISDRLKAALKVNSEEAKQQESNDASSGTQEEKAVITTVEEMEGYMIIKAIIRQSVDLSRILHKDTQAYFGIMLDNQKGTFCRLYFNGKNKYITTFDENRKEVRHNIETMDDIYKFSDTVLGSLKMRLSE